jgi:ribosomal protein S18 acetylase RimI-like enzyme
MEYMNIQLREASVEEIPIVFRTMQLAFSEYKDRLFPPSGALTETISHTETIFARGGGAVIAWDGDMAVGSARYEFHEDYIYIGRVSVVPSYRGRGISKSMLNKIEGIAITKGIGDARVEVRLSIPDNIMLYKKLNYQPIEQIYYTEGTDSWYVMSKKLLYPLNEKIIFERGK